MSCPCLSGLPYAECCEPFHLGTTNAPTAERLMRSRYTAYALELPEYILATWHASTRPKTFTIDPDIRWYRLDILSRTRGGMLDTVGTVEFTASFRLGGETATQHETSTFVREGGRWFYLDGPPEPRAGVKTSLDGFSRSSSTWENLSFLAKHIMLPTAVVQAG